MSLKNPIIFGLEAQRNLADIPNNNLALQSLNLNILDLDIIRGSKNANVNEFDFRNLSGLSEPIFRRLGRYVDDSQQYEQLISEKAGYNSILFGNLSINGALDGNAVRYRYVATDPDTGSKSIAIADISTSRISSWSSSANPATSTSPISYGAQVAINTGGELRFGTQSGTTGTRLRTTITPEAKEFPSEFPTHKIQATIDGQTRSLYAMKGIPLTFRGYFRKVNAEIKLESLIQGTPPSWKISNVSGGGVTKFINQGGATSEINYSSSVSKERYIQFYYNPDNITFISIPSALISELPVSKFSRLVTFSFPNNDLRNFPDLTDIAPNLKSLNFSKNPFHQSDNSNERRVNENVINKIPADLTSLTFGGTFGGDIPKDILGRFTSLTTLNLSHPGGGSKQFAAATNPGVCTCPNVSNTVTNYTINNNAFTSIDSSPGTDDNGDQLVSVKTSTSIIELSLQNNGPLLDNTFSIAADNNSISTINISRTRLPIPDLNGKQSLTRFTATNVGNVGQSLSFFSGSTYKFNNCNSLTSLELSATAVSGALPQFNNTSLTNINLRSTSITGGEHNGSTQFVIPELTFQNTPELQLFRLTSNSLLSGKSIHPNAFTFTPKLSDLWWTSSGRTNGTIKDLFNQCPVLRVLRFYSNAFTGFCPNFQQQKDHIYYVHLAFNQLTGDIPAFANLSQLYQLRLYNNNFTGLNQFTNLPRLRYFWCHNNQISGQIPDFSECPILYYLVMYNNQFTTYKSGAFKSITQIRYIDLGSNKLTQTSVNQIILDLYDNYLAAPRGGVVINLVGPNNAAPSGEALDLITILESNTWDIRSN
tara:strand:- start:772 stop:3237 length:2466 start_codon:yes stop_codon:yes gene_type:complete